MPKSVPSPRPPRGSAAAAEPKEARSGTQSIERAVLMLRVIASRGRRGMRIADVAGTSGLTQSTCFRMLQCLQNEGLVVTFRGRGGGMRLARPADQIAVGDVVRRFENLDSFVACFPGGGGCVVNGPCALKPALGEALAAFLAHLDGYRLSDLVPDRAAFLERLLPDSPVAA